MTPKGDAQSAETFRVVGMDETYGGRLRFSEKILGLRLALCPLSFLGSLKPFFSFSARERKEWVQKSVPLGAEETGRSGRTESSAPTGSVGDRRLQRCIATAPRPSSVCFADTFPGGEGNPLRRGRADRVVRPYGCGGRSEVVPMY